MSADSRRALGSARARYNLVLLGVLAGTASVLAAVGIYGLLAYTVSLRTREIGIRKALGAGSAALLTRLGRHVVLSVSLGLALGWAGAGVAGRVLAGRDTSQRMKEEQALGERRGPAECQIVPANVHQLVAERHGALVARERAAGHRGHQDDRAPDADHLQCLDLIRSPHARDGCESDDAGELFDESRLPGEGRHRTGDDGTQRTERPQQANGLHPWGVSLSVVVPAAAS